MNGKTKEKGLFRVAIYFNEADLSAIAKDAEKAGKRTVGIPIKRQKPHGMADEWLANTDGIGRFLKTCYDYWKTEEPRRLEALAEAKKQKEAAEARIEALEKGRATSNR